jgi:hypothetical protein
MRAHADTVKSGFSLYAFNGSVFLGELACTPAPELRRWKPVQETIDRQ